MSFKEDLNQDFNNNDFRWIQQLLDTEMMDAEESQVRGKRWTINWAIWCFCSQNPIYFSLNLYNWFQYYIIYTDSIFIPNTKFEFMLGEF